MTRDAIIFNVIFVLVTFILLAAFILSVRKDDKNRDPNDNRFIKKN